MGKEEANMPSARLFLGTSGFSYKEWRGIFYPEDLPAKSYLSFYAKHFNTTEINNTFYRLPTPKLTQGWHDEVPNDFSFTLKLSQKITHIRRLKNVEVEMEVFLNAAAELKGKLGPILVQLPPNLKKNIEVLGQFLSQYAAGRKLAFEFRHESWFVAEVYGLLREHGAALGVVETEKSEDAPTPLEVTGSFVYMRLRKGEYSTAELERWADWIRAQDKDVYCYMKHDAKAPVLAQNLMDVLEKRPRQ